MDPRGGTDGPQFRVGPMDLRVGSDGPQGGVRWTSGWGPMDLGWGPMDLRVGSDGPRRGPMVADTSSFVCLVLGFVGFENGMLDFGFALFLNP